MSTKCSVQPDGPPCIYLAQPIQDVHHNLKFEIYQAQHGDSIIKILLRDFTTTCLSCNLISDQDTDWHLTFWLFSKLNLRSLSTYELLSCNYVTPSTIPVQLCSFSRNIETQCKMQIVISNVIQFDVIWFVIIGFDFKFVRRKLCSGVCCIKSYVWNYLRLLTGNVPTC